MGSACSTNRAKMNAYKILEGKQDGKSALRRRSRVLVVNIRMNLRGIGQGGINRIDLVQNNTNRRITVSLQRPLSVQLPLR
jgi:hypothetical protein